MKGATRSHGKGGKGPFWNVNGYRVMFGKNFESGPPFRGKFCVLIGLVFLALNALVGPYELIGGGRIIFQGVIGCYNLRFTWGKGVFIG